MGLVQRRLEDILFKLETNPETEFLYCYRYDFAISLRDRYAEEFSKNKNCECALEFVKKYPNLDDCTCTSCTKNGTDYPDCTCNPWNTTIGDAWYAPQRYHYMKCHMEHEMDYANDNLEKLLQNWTTI